MDALLISFRFFKNHYFVGHISSVTDVPVSPLSESQNRLLSNDQHANSIGDHLANNTLESGEDSQG